MKNLEPKVLARVKEITSGCYKDYQLLLEKVCKNLGLKHFDGKYEDNISGAIIKEGDEYNIYVNRNHPITRKRFTIAHEIGHYISFLEGSYSKAELEENGGFEDYAISYRKDGKTSEAEQEANLIAAEMLMPQEKVQELIYQGISPERMAELFFVSPSAMTLRLVKLKHISPDSMAI